MQNSLQQSNFKITEESMEETPLQHEEAISRLFKSSQQGPTASENKENNNI